MPRKRSSRKWRRKKRSERVARAHAEHMELIRSAGAMVDQEKKVYGPAASSKCKVSYRKVEILQERALDRPSTAATRKVWNAAYRYLECLARRNPRIAKDLAERDIDLYE